MKSSRKIRKIVFKNLGGILKASKSIASEWGIKHIPLITLKFIIDKSKPKLTGDKETDSFLFQYNKTLDSLYSGCYAIAKKMNSKISLFLK